MYVRTYKKIFSILKRFIIKLNATLKDPVGSPGKIPTGSCFGRTDLQFKKSNDSFERLELC